MGEVVVDSARGLKRLWREGKLWRFDRVVFNTFELISQNAVDCFRDCDVEVRALHRAIRFNRDYENFEISGPVTCARFGPKARVLGALTVKVAHKDYFWRDDLELPEFAHKIRIELHSDMVKVGTVSFPLELQLLELRGEAISREFVQRALKRCRRLEFRVEFRREGPGQAFVWHAYTEGADFETGDDFVEYHFTSEL